MSAVKEVRLRNIGKSTIYGHHPDEIDAEGKPREYAFKPETSGAFHPDEAAKLKRLYPRTIMDIDDVQKLFSDTPKEPGSEAPEVPMISVEQAKAEREDAIQKAVAEALEAERAKTAETSTDETGDEEKEPEEPTEEELMAKLEKDEAEAKELKEKIATKKAAKK